MLIVPPGDVDPFNSNRKTAPLLDGCPVNTNDWGLIVKGKFASNDAVVPGVMLVEALPNAPYNKGRIKSATTGAEKVPSDHLRPTTGFCWFIRLSPACPTGKIVA